MNPYATNKLLYHPEIVNAIGNGNSSSLFPTQVHLMPCNRCNQNCTYCAYRIDGGIQSKSFDTKKEIPLDTMELLIAEIYSAGVKAVEITGGGEPLLYTHINSLLTELGKTSIDTALVTNGTLLTDELADRLYSTKLLWARVSIDSANSSTYTKIRRVPPEMMNKAWFGVDRLVKRKKNQVIGIGFVITPENHREIFDLCQEAKNHGVDNIRISVPITPKYDSIFSDEEYKIIKDELLKARELNCESFTVIDRFDERITGLKLQKQTISYCYAKDMICVIDGCSNLYTCCCLTGNNSGFIGNIESESFINLWKRKEEFRRNHNPSKQCNCVCMYNTINKIAAELSNVPPHVNFI